MSFPCSKSTKKSPVLLRVKGKVQMLSTCLSLGSRQSSLCGEHLSLPPRDITHLLCLLSVYQLEWQLHEGKDFPLFFSLMYHSQEPRIQSSHRGSAVTNPTSIHEDVGSILALLSGLRIQHCHELWCSLQMRLDPAALL